MGEISTEFWILGDNSMEWYVTGQNSTELARIRPNRQERAKFDRIGANSTELTQKFYGIAFLCCFLLQTTNLAKILWNWRKNSIELLFCGFAKLFVDSLEFATSLQNCIFGGMVPRWSRKFYRICCSGFWKT